MKKTKILKVVLFSIVIILSVLFLGKRYFNATKFEYAGTIEATKIDISSQLSSLIKNISAQEGDDVTENELLIELDCNATKIAAELANTNYQRNLTLLNSGTVSQSTFDTIKNQKESADVQLSWCKIISPLNGTVLTRYHEPGELVLPGTKILTIANIKDVFAYIYIAQSEISALTVGQKLMATVPNANNENFVGTIIKINEEAEFTPKNVQTKNEKERLVFGIKVSFAQSNQKKLLKPGMTIYIDSLKPAQKDE